MLSVFAWLTFFAILVLIYVWAQRRIRRQEKMMDVEVGTGYAKIPNQDDDIWNISSRVNQQGHGPVQSPPGNWPTHDHRLSVSDFVLVPEYTHKQNKPPPPPYSEVDLPSYEQATGCPVPRADLPPVHQNRGAGSSQ